MRRETVSVVMSEMVLSGRAMSRWSSMRVFSPLSLVMLRSKERGLVSAAVYLKYSRALRPAVGDC